MARGDPISVEFRFPQMGVTLMSPRDSVLVSEALEITNMRRSGPIVNSDIGRSPTSGGTKRGGLNVWFNTTADLTNGVSGPCNHMGLARSVDPTTGIPTDFVLLHTGVGAGTWFSGSAAQGSTLASLTPAVTTPAGRIRSDQFGSKLYVTGVNASGLAQVPVIFTPQSLVFSAWTMPASMFGTGSALNGPTNVQIYRGSALLTNRHTNQYVFSKVGDPTNFNYASTPFATAAYLGNSSAKAGVPGDLIIEPVAFGDDYAVLLCKSSVWQINADPRDGGRVVKVTDETGIQETGLGFKAWCFDAAGRLWFLGNRQNDLYVMEKGGVPRGVGNQKMRRFFAATNSGGSGYAMAYDSKHRCILIVSPLGFSDEANALWYEVDTGHWWFDFFAGNPYGCFPNPNPGGDADSNSPLVVFSDNAQPHYLTDSRSGDRQNNAGSVTSSVAITSRVRFAPVQIAGGDAESMCLDLTAQVELGSSPINWYWLTADSPADVAVLPTSSAAASGQFFPSGSTPARARTVSVRATGGAHQLVIESVGNTPMLLQRFTARFAGRGPRRI